MKKFLLAGFLLASIAAYGGVGEVDGAVPTIGTIIADLELNLEAARLDMGIMTPGQTNVTSWDGHTRTSPAQIGIMGQTDTNLPDLATATIEYYIPASTTITHFNDTTKTMVVDLYTENTLGTVNDTNKGDYIGLGNYESELATGTTRREVALVDGDADVYVQGHITTAADMVGDYAGAFNFHARYKDDTPWN